MHLKYSFDTHRVWGIYTLTIADLSWYFYGAVEKIFAFSDHLQANLSVVHHQCMSNLRCLNNFRVRKHNSCFVAFGCIQVEAERLALVQNFPCWTREFPNLCNTS